MLPYFALFSYFAVAGLAGGSRQATGGRFNSPVLLLGAVIITVMIGLRYKVGADWTAYYDMYRWAGMLSLDRLISVGGDTGYLFVNWFAHRLGGQMWVANLICGAVFSWGLYRLATVQPDPWMAMLVAVPYLVVVVAMGYARQGVAIGLLMAGLAHLSRGGSFPRFIVYVAVAAMFHRTAIVALPLAGLGSARGRVMNFFILFAGALALFNLVLSDHLDVLFREYILTSYSSEGAAIRIFMSVVPATIYFVFRNRLGFTVFERGLWRNFSLAAFAFLFLLLVSPSSTAVDRLALYVLPLQLAVLSRVPMLLESQAAGRAILVAYSFLVLFVWLNFAKNASSWLPYQYYSLF